MNQLADSLTGVIEQARRAAERNPAMAPLTDAQERMTRLSGVLERLPPGALKTRRHDLEARMAPDYLKAISRWHWGSGNMVLSGGTGKGKTSAAVHLARRLVAEGCVNGGQGYDLCRFIRWQECRELSAAVREYKLGAGLAEDVIRCQNARLLILDDLGANDDRVTLERVLEVRNQRAWPTITTTGLKPEELKGTFGDALSRRLLECGGDKGHVVSLWAGK